MFNIKKSIIKDIFKSYTRNDNNIVKIFISKYYICKVCQGKGYIISKDNKYKICNLCSGVGMRHYTYF